MSEQIVTVDIGGTHARFAIAEIEGGRVVSLGEATTLHTKDHASFQTAWQDFERQQGGALPRAVAIAIAGPTWGEIIRFTNNPWIIRPALINEKLNVDRSEEHTSELQSLMRISYAVFCLNKKNIVKHNNNTVYAT